MSTPDADDAPSSPDCSGTDDGDMAAEQKTGPHAAHGGAPDQKPGSSTTKAANAKDPTRPRRKKARRACFACQRAHLTCGDERPCHRCVKRGLADNCMDGVRKKAKYLHDAPDGALLPGVVGHYSQINGGHAVPLPSQDQSAVAAQQAYYPEPPPPTPYFAQSPAIHAPAAQAAAFAHPPPPMSPPYGEAVHAAMPAAPPTVSQGPPPHLQQAFGAPLFDPGDPALFHFDISSLNFGNHYGALELGMLGHMSSGAAEAVMNDSPLHPPAGLYDPQAPPATYGDNQGVAVPMSLGPDGMPTDWQHSHSRHGSLQVQTPSNTPVTVEEVQQGSYRCDSFPAPLAYAIGQGPSSLSSASPASTHFPSNYDADNPIPSTTFFANAQPPPAQQAQRSPTTSRLYGETRQSGTPLQPVHAGTLWKRHPDGKSIYASVTKAYDYVKGFHRLYVLLKTRYSPYLLEKASEALGRFRPVLMSTASSLDREDLIHAEKNLQRSLVTLHLSFAEVGTPSLIVRRSGEVVGMNKEFEILTGWKRDVLLGYLPNQNVNRGPHHHSDDSEASGRLNITPTLPGQEPDSGPHPVNILELMDQPSGVQYLDDFADLCFEDALGKGHRRINMLRYLTREDMARMADRAAGAWDGKSLKSEAMIKQEDGSIHQGEAAMMNLSSNGLIDAMIMWHIKRDNFDMPMLIAMQIMPMLKP